MNDKVGVLGFAAAHDTPVPYMQRLRDYYLALGYDNPYRWAQYTRVPFTPLEKPLSEARVALITTAAPLQPGKGEQGSGAPYNSAAKFYRVYSDSTAEDHDLGISHLGYDRKHTTAEDINSFFPLAALRQAVADGLISELNHRFYGTPTDRSQVATIERDCAELLSLAREDEIDAAVLVPN